MCDWSTATTELAKAAGVLARPPPLLVARLAARAAEALCRLCRGEGLDGAYAPAPQWEFAASKMLVMKLVPTECEAVLATARACLPYWLEAAGWAAALMSDATAAAMGRLPATPRTASVRNAHALAMVREGSETSTLERILSKIGNRASNDAFGLETLSASAQGEVHCRLFHCGLAASLDHTLRLLYSAHDRSLTGFDELLRQATTSMMSIFRLNLAPMLSPSVAAPASDGETNSSSAAAESDSGAGAGGAGSTDQIGLLYTLSKRAAMLTRALEAGAGAAAEAGGGEGRRQVTEHAAEVVAWLSSAMHGVGVEGKLGWRVQAARQAAAAGAGDGGVVGATAWQTDAACVDEAHEALARAARAACNLAAPLAWQLAADRAAAAARGPAVRRSRVRGTQAAVEDKGTDWCGRVGEMAFCNLLDCMPMWWLPPLLLPPAHLLDCQPHRLLAAVYALAEALPATERVKGELEVAICALVPNLSSHKTLSGRVRTWLAPRPPPGASCSSTSNASGSDAWGPDGDALAGCLEAPVKSVIRHTHSREPTVALRAEALLRIAAGQIAPEAGVPCCEGGRDLTGEADGGFQQYAAAIVQADDNAFADPSLCANPEVMALHEPLLPDGSKAGDLVVEEGEGAGRLSPPPPPPPSAPSGPLPPPLVQPPGSSLALPRLRMCGNPRCGNFGGDCEEALPLKQCGGCRAVRYCGPDCQRGHWREGHKAECKELAAFVAKQAAVGL